MELDIKKKFTYRLWMTRLYVCNSLLIPVNEWALNFPYFYVASLTCIFRWATPDLNVYNVSDEALSCFRLRLSGCLCLVLWNSGVSIVSRIDLWISHKNAYRWFRDLPSKRTRVEIGRARGRQLTPRLLCDHSLELASNAPPWTLYFHSWFTNVRKKENIECCYLNVPIDAPLPPFNFIQFHSIVLYKLYNFLETFKVGTLF